MVAKPLQRKINQLEGRSPVLCALWWWAQPAEEKDPGEVEHLGIPATASHHSCYEYSPTSFAFASKHCLEKKGEEKKGKKDSVDSWGLA